MESERSKGTVTEVPFSSTGPKCCSKMAGASSVLALPFGVTIPACITRQRLIHGSSRRSTGFDFHLRQVPRPGPPCRTGPAAAHRPRPNISHQSRSLVAALEHAPFPAEGVWHTVSRRERRREQERPALGYRRNRAPPHRFVRADDAALILRGGHGGSKYF